MSLQPDAVPNSSTIKIAKPGKPISYYLYILPPKLMIILQFDCQAEMKKTCVFPEE